MEILGHSQISVTMNTYAHVLPESQRQAVERLTNLFGVQAASGVEERGTAPEAGAANAAVVLVGGVRCQHPEG